MEIIGNVSILSKHLNDQKIDVTLEKKTIGEEINFKDYDFIFIGSGTEKNLEVVIQDFRNRKIEIEEYINMDKILLMTGNSFEMLGKKIDNIDGLGIFDFEVQREKERETSDVIYNSKYFKNKIVGFVNKMTKIYHNMNPLFEVEFGIGENENNDYEGIKYKNLYGTHVSGPILVRNPEILNEFVKIISQKQKIKYKNIDYKNEDEGYNLVLKELEKRKEQEIK